MIVYRITNETYKSDLSGNGAALLGSRWNSKGMRLLYTSQHISLSILESLVHLKTQYIPNTQYLLHIELPVYTEVKEISLSSLKDKWHQHIGYTQWIGDQFLQNIETLVLQVPSVVVQQEYNFLLNPLHHDFKKVKITNAELLELDKRLLGYQ